MRFKKPKSLHRSRGTTRATADTPTPETDTFDSFWEYCQENSDFKFTPALDRALDLIAHDKSVAEVERVELYILRTSWGNWFPYAVQGGEAMSMPMPDFDDHGMAEKILRRLVFGPGNCPLCRTPSTSDPHRIYRWHRLCLARAFARDAERFGNEKQKQWAAEVFAKHGRV